MQPMLARNGLHLCNKNLSYVSKYDESRITLLVTWW